MNYGDKVLSIDRIGVQATMQACSARRTTAVQVCCLDEAARSPSLSPRSAPRQYTMGPGSDSRQRDPAESEDHAGGMGLK